MNNCINRIYIFTATLCNTLLSFNESINNVNRRIISVCNNYLSARKQTTGTATFKNGIVNIYYLLAKAFINPCVEFAYSFPYKNKGESYLKHDVHSSTIYRKINLSIGKIINA
jgi:hypothetical protein